MLTQGLHMIVKKIFQLLIISFLMQPIVAWSATFPVHIYLVHSSEVLKLPNPIEVDLNWARTYSMVKGRVIISFENFNNFRLNPQEIELNCVSQSFGFALTPIQNPNDALLLDPNTKACSARVYAGDRFNSSKSMAENVRILVQQHFSHIDDLISRGTSLYDIKRSYSSVKNLELLSSAEFEGLIPEKITTTFVETIKKELTEALLNVRARSKLNLNFMLSISTDILSSTQLDAIKKSLGDLINDLFIQGSNRFLSDSLADATKIWQGLMMARLLSDDQQKQIDLMWQKKLDYFSNALKNNDFNTAQHIHMQIAEIYGSSTIYKTIDRAYKDRADDIKMVWMKAYFNEIKINLENKNYYEVMRALKNIENLNIFTVEAFTSAACGVPSTSQELQLYLLKSLENQIENQLLAGNDDEAARLLLLLSEKDYQGIPIPENFFPEAYDKFAFRIDPRKTNSSLRIPGRDFEYSIGVRFLSEDKAAYDVKNNKFFKLKLPAGTSIEELRQAIAGHFERSPINICGRFLKPTFEEILIHAFDDHEYAKLNWYDQHTNNINHDYVISIKMPYYKLVHLESSLAMIWGRTEDGDKLGVYSILDQPFANEADRNSLNFFYKQLNKILNQETFTIDERVIKLSFFEREISDYNASTIVKQKLLTILNKKLLFLTTISSIKESIEQNNHEKAIEDLDSIIYSDTFTKKEKEEAQEYYDKYFVQADLNTYYACIRETQTLKNLEAVASKITAEIETRQYNEKQKTYSLKIVSNDIKVRREYLDNPCIRAINQE